MKEEAFRSWLSSNRGDPNGRALAARTVKSRRSECKRVEQFEGDLDHHFGTDHLRDLVDRLTYSESEERHDKPARHKIEIKGNLHNGTATLRSAVSLYKRFRESSIEGTPSLPPISRPAKSPSTQAASPIVQKRAAGEDAALCPQTTTNAPYRTIKALVLDFVHRNGGNVDYATLTEEVRKFRPTSKWQRSHWAWYRHQILHGKFKEQFTEKERAAIQAKAPRTEIASPVGENRTVGVDLARGPQARDSEAKRIGDAILNHVRFVISLAAGDSIDKRFKLNRWVFARLMQDEIRVKRPIKKLLWEKGMRICQGCGEAFESLKGVEIHRKDGAQGYSGENCELLCRECHQELD